MLDDRRLIEDYLPIQAISAEASREKSVRKGHISTLHLWWARRPLVACRAAVYGALVPASRFIPENGPDNKKQSLGRANAAKFVERLCKYPGNPAVIKEAQQHILEAHAERLTQETGKKVTVEDIEAGRAPRPKVLDMFAGGGAIPLEALRLGCEAYALDLNPVAHIIELCTLVYPQKYGKPDATARGMTGPPLQSGATVPVASVESGVSVPVAKTNQNGKRDAYPTPQADKRDACPTACPTLPEILEQTVFFNPEEPIEIAERRLPHWRQPGVTYFVTFRLADALPRERIEQLRAEREIWLRTHKEPYSANQRKEYFRLFSERVQDWLDAGEGECLMRNESVAKIVADALRHFDGQRYDLTAWAVMPNHVHALVAPRPGWELEQVLHSWKSFTAHEINKKLSRTGQVWQHEGYDHIVRNPAALFGIAEYIADNPRKAALQKPFVFNGLAAQGDATGGATGGATVPVANPEDKRDACPTIRSWGGLANEVRYWGEWVLKKVKAEIGDLYPPIPDPAFKGKRPEIEFDRESGEWIVSRKAAKFGRGRFLRVFASWRETRTPSRLPDARRLSLDAHGDL